MTNKPVLFIITILAVRSWGIWVPTPDNTGDIFEPPGAFVSDSSFTWVDIPDVGAPLLPPAAAVSQGSDAEAPRFNDVSCDMEYGLLSFKPERGSKFSGFGMAARARYERMTDEYTGMGIRIQNEYTRYTKINDSIEFGRPGCDFLLIGGFFHTAVLSGVDVGGHANLSLFFRRLQRWDTPTSSWKDSTLQTDYALNPSLYGVYNYSLDLAVPGMGPFSGYVGVFAGYTYANFSYSKHQLPYAGIASLGTTIGQRVAIQTDIAASHQFVVLGAQVPIFISRLFSIVPGFKFPIVFEARQFTNLRFTVGASSRF